MDYYSKYSKCNNYYTIYNKKCKSREYLFFIDLLHCQLYLIDGKSHNLNGPAYISYYTTTGKKYCEKYKIYDNYHNINGPALIYYSPDGTPAYEYYYIDGKIL